VKRVVVFNTHLDVGPGTAEDVVHRHGSSQQLHQLDELKGIMDLELTKLGGKSDGDVRDTAVLVTGDFNMIAQSSFYWQHLLPLSSEPVTDGTQRLRDVYQQPMPKGRELNQPREEAASYDAHSNALATDKEASGRIDYVFAVDQWVTKDGRRLVFTPFVAKQCHVAKDLVQPVASDHYPIYCELVPLDDVE
jgi:endonuclease/exonuclease/phosphatase family metal-dependent hydrolase